jgi:hypothetical protein
MLIILSQTPIHINKDVLIYGIQEKGIAKFLYKLNINKASGPDSISCRILREAADEIAPYLKFIFEKSLELKNVPYDWRTAFPEKSGVRHGVKSLAEIKDEHIHLLLVIQVSADFFDCDY